MRLEKYELEIDQTQTIFHFVSEGPKGRILKNVYFTKMKVKGFRNIYNLAFGDKIEGLDDIDDRIVTGNQDREKILATVANTVMIFTKLNPKVRVFIVGSNPARTRLYQMAISKYFDELSETFEIKGFLHGDFSRFKKNMNYTAFLIKRKIR
jgi:hypothetical protein